MKVPQERPRKEAHPLHHPDIWEIVGKNYVRRSVPWIYKSIYKLGKVEQLDFHFQLKVRVVQTEKGFPVNPEYDGLWHPILSTGRGDIVHP